MDALEESWESASRHYSGFRVPFEDFRDFVGRSDAADTAAATYGEDVYLVLGCLAGANSAIQALEAIIKTSARHAASLVDSDPDRVAEVLQQLRGRLLIGVREGEPKLALYSGRGSLKAWLAVSATRLALNLRNSAGQAAKRQGALADAFLEPSAENLETEYMKSAYAGELRQAVENAFAALPSRDRAVMRMFLVERLNIDAIGRVYQVHRSTVARWLAASREKVFDHAAGAFRDGLGVSEDRFASLSRLLVSQLDVHFSAVLGPSLANGSTTANALP